MIVIIAKWKRIREEGGAAASAGSASQAAGICTSGAFSRSESYSSVSESPSVWCDRWLERSLSKLEDIALWIYSVANAKPGTMPLFRKNFAPECGRRAGGLSQV